MKRSLALCLLLLTFLWGNAVYAVETTILVLPDKAFYRPGETVTLHVSASAGARVEATIRYLDETITTLSAPVAEGAARLEWQPEPLAPRGYGVDIRLLDADGLELATTSTAFDVLERWIQAPRYGFLSEFKPGRDNADETMSWAAQYHVNGLQFYDWQYRHETLLPPSEPYVDVLGRELSLETVKRLIDAAHERNIAAMPYTAIYGASMAFYREHPDWALFSSGERPFEFGENFLIIMDPTPGSPWATHLLGEFARVLDETAFDGIHIDQYGAPMRGRNSAGEMVSLEQVFPAFINEAAALVEAKRGDDSVVLFNAVRNWPVAAVAPSDVDAVYIEVWDPYRHFMDLPRLVSRAQELGGGKPVIIAAYIHPDRPHNVRLANALIFASGGYHLELGEPGAMLADPYFPQFGMMAPDVQATTRAYYDFLVRYENVLALGTTGAPDRAAALAIEGVMTNTRRSRDRVAVIARRGEGRETFSLINLMGIGGELWDEPLPNGPTPLRDLPVQLRVDAPVERLWYASPDDRDPQARPLPFTQRHDDTGRLIEFTLPSLDYWTMIVVEYRLDR